jgi:hypothetical protein
MVRTPPPGWAPSARRAASTIEPICIYSGWTVLLVIGPPLWGLFFWAYLAFATVELTRPAPGGSLSLHGAAV